MKEFDVTYRTCARCGNPVPRERTASAKYCSQKCSKSATRDSATRVCKETECTRPERARGLCSMHYKRVHTSDATRAKEAGRRRAWRASAKLDPSKSQAERLRLAMRRWERFDATRCGIARAVDDQMDSLERNLSLGQCPWCDQPSILLKSLGGLCSIACCQDRKAYRKTHPKRYFTSGPCGMCGDHFVGVSYTSKRLAMYCSSRCARGAVKLSRGQFWVSKKRRQRLYERDGWTCQLCMEPVRQDLHYMDDFAPSLDHIIPRSKGGSHADGNLRLAHRWCNAIRGDDSYYTAEDLAPAA